MQVKSKRALSCTFLFAPSPRGCGNIFIVEVPSNSSTSPCIQMTWRACQLQLEYLQNSSQMLRRKSRSLVLTHRVKCSRGYLQGAFLAFTSPTVQRTCGSLMALFPFHLLSFICKISPILFTKTFTLRLKPFLHEAFHWTLEHLGLHFQRMLTILQRHISHTGFSLFLSLSRAGLLFIYYCVPSTQYITCYMKGNQ